MILCTVLVPTPRPEWLQLPRPRLDPRRQGRCRSRAIPAILPHRPEHFAGASLAFERPYRDYAQYAVVRLAA
jgi:hypothetical protein